MNKTKLILYISIAFFIISFIFLLSSFEGNNSTSVIAYQQINSVIDKNENYTFAGELVPIHDQEVLERLDRELMVNTYWHSNTLYCMKQSHKYFPIIEPILSQYGIPDDFKYLAVAESGLRNAISPAGAKGIWQFMKTTANQYGLYVSNQVDERYDIEKATRAACQYFLNSYQNFGSWTAVAASYNMGTAGYQRRVNKQLDMDYYHLYLNSETSRYVFRIVALKYIMSNPQKYGFLYNPDTDGYDFPPSDLMAMPIPINDIPLWAKERGTNYKMLRFMNPWIRDEQITNYNGSEVLVKVPR